MCSNSLKRTPYTHTQSKDFEVKVLKSRRQTWTFGIFWAQNVNNRVVFLPIQNLPVRSQAVHSHRDVIWFSLQVLFQRFADKILSLFVWFAYEVDSWLPPWPHMIFPASIGNDQQNKAVFVARTLDQCLMETIKIKRFSVAWFQNGILQFI